MSEETTIDRFEELEAGRILGDLSSEEWSEWRSLAEDRDHVPDFSLELTAAALEEELAAPQSTTLPTGLQERLLADLPREAPNVPTEEVIVTGSFGGRLLRSPSIAWAAAAVLAILLVVSLLTQDPTATTGELPPLVDRTDDLIKATFGGAGGYASMSGTVEWSDKLQEGVMTLTGLPVNDPGKNQYQLWIVDPDRDEAPVDGGVFDVTKAGTVKVPIDAKLAVSNPDAFVITLEKPGGVVRSKLEVVVAQAKPS